MQYSVDLLGATSNQGGRIVQLVVKNPAVQERKLVVERMYSEALYTWLMSPEQEQLLCDALAGLGPVDTEQGLHAEGVRKIQEVLHCTLADARATLQELRARKRI